MSLYEIFVLSFSFLPAPFAMLLLAVLAFLAFVVVLEIWGFIKDKIPFL